MKRIALLLFAVTFGLSVIAQEESPYVFTTIKDNASTEVKDQCRTGTCWSYATLSFIESEILRLGNGSHNISEMYNVRMTYPEKADLYVRLHGKYQFSAGSLSHDVINVIAEHGMVPEEVYSGLNYGKDEHDHAELELILEGMMKNLAENNRGSLSPTWKLAFNAVLDVYLGEAPEKFEYQGKEYTPSSFRDAMGINAEDYVSITSFTHHPFYESFILEVPDNFSRGSFYNVPLNELNMVMQNAIDNGYTVAWDADVSEKGFSFRNGMAILPANDVQKDQLFNEVVTEMEVTQKNRQLAFDSFATTDDHLMHITGTAKDQAGTPYFIMKNSWGSGNKFEGRQYISQSYFNMKTVAILVHKDAIPKAIKKKLGL